MAIVCNCPGKCEIHPKPKGEALRPVNGGATLVPPDIDAMDKLTLKTLETEFLKSQLEFQSTMVQAQQRVQSTKQQLEQFIATMHDKYAVKQLECELDLSKLQFVPRSRLETDPGVTEKRIAAMQQQLGSPR